MLSCRDSSFKPTEAQTHSRRSFQVSKPKLVYIFSKPASGHLEQYLGS